MFLVLFIEHKDQPLAEAMKPIYQEVEQEIESKKVDFVLEIGTSIQFGIVRPNLDQVTL